MNSEQILEALRLVAMGRPQHDRVRELAAYLAKPEPVLPEVEVVPLPLAVVASEQAPAVDPEASIADPAPEAAPTPKPKRGSKKA